MNSEQVPSESMGSGNVALPGDTVASQGAARPSLSSDPLTLTSQRGCDFDIADDGDGFMLGMTPVAEPSTWMWIDRTQATALRNWLNKVIPNE